MEAAENSSPTLVNESVSAITGSVDEVLDLVPRYEIDGYRQSEVRVVNVSRNNICHELNRLPHDFGIGEEGALTSERPLVDDKLTVIHSGEVTVSHREK